MKISYKIHGRDQVTGDKAHDMYRRLCDLNLIPGRLTAGWNSDKSHGWIEICPARISVVFNLEYDMADEFFSVLASFDDLIRAKAAAPAASKQEIEAIYLDMIK